MQSEMLKLGMQKAGVDPIKTGIEAMPVFAWLCFEPVSTRAQAALGTDVASIPA